jgi:hypothetical protein
MSALGIILIVVGVILLFWGPKSLNLSVRRTGLRIRGLAGPILIILGILVLTGVIK